VASRRIKEARVLGTRREVTEEMKRVLLAPLRHRV
jgi:hypothetical protein